MPRTILAEYFMLETSVLLCIVREDFPQPHIVEIPCSPPALKAFIQTNFRVTPDEADVGWTSAGKVFKLPASAYQEMMEPLVKPLFGLSPFGDAMVGPDDVIWFVPHDVLHYVPLHAIQVDGLSVIDRNAVCYTPSASIMKYCSAKRKGRRQSIVIFADSRSDDPDQRLVHAREQTHDLGKLFGSAATAYVGPDATKANLYDYMRSHDVDILHLACHGVFRAEDPLQSSITLAPGPQEEPYPPFNANDRPGNGPDPWDLTAKEVFRLQLNVDLVTLSACESGASQQRAGDELIGLIRAFIYAGTPSLLVSLWSVDEITTSLLMEFFYRALLGGKNKAEALRTAQQELKGLTIQQALDFAYALQSRLEASADPWTAQMIRKSIADLHRKAANYSAALDEYRRLDTLPDLKPSLWASITNSMVMCDRRLSQNHPIDYGMAVYDHPFYWSAFVLVGDWQ
jgi:CHAT domain-containing protein